MFCDVLCGRSALFLNRHLGSDCRIPSSVAGVLVFLGGLNQYSLGLFFSVVCRCSFLTLWGVAALSVVFLYCTFFFFVECAWSKM